MKRILIVVGCLWILSTSAEAPPTHIVYQEPKPESKIDSPFGIEDPILLSFMWYESKYDVNAEQTVTKARGVLQILPIMIEEANRLRSLQKSSIRYTWDDAWSVEKSIEIWYLVQNHHNPNYNLQEACKIWFGRGVQYDGTTWVEYHAGVNSFLSTLLEVNNG